MNISQTTNLIRRFEELGKPYESILIPGDTHHWMKWENMIRVDQATADFLKKTSDEVKTAIENYKKSLELYPKNEHAQTKIESLGNYN